MTAPAKQAAAAPVSIPRTPHGSTALRLVPTGRLQPPRAPFVALVVGLLAAGLVGLLILNTIIAENSFRARDLQARGVALDLNQQRLQRHIDALEAPAALASRARSLGMVPAGAPAFIRLTDGKVLGHPTPATVPSPAPMASASPSAGASAPAPAAGSGPPAGWTTVPANAAPAKAAVAAPAPAGAATAGAHR
jgi:hypothetical protein